jgi:predicted PurR-regulated permease PerM
MSEKRDQPTHTRELQLGTRARLRAFVLLALTVGGIYICYLLLLPFLPGLVWALALAILFMPVHRWVEAKLSNGDLAAAISVLLIGLIVVLPIIVISSWIIEGAAEGAAAAHDRITSGEWRRSLASNEALAPLTRWLGHVNLQSAVENLTTWLTATSASLVGESLLGVTILLLTLYLLFYFLRDREAALDWLRKISPLSRSEMDRLFGRVVDAVEATFYGTVVVAAVQGALGGLMFWWLDLPTPVFWGLVMGLLAMVPILGAFIVWIPAAILLALDGSWGKALILSAWGAVVVGVVDNILYPILVKDRLRLHTIPAFISIVGGLILFGASGLLLGPLVVTVTMCFLEIWRVPIRGTEA